MGGHIHYKRSIAMPSFARLNTSFPIISKVPMLGIITTSMHIPPSHIKRSTKRYGWTVFFRNKCHLQPTRQVKEEYALSDRVCHLDADENRSQARFTSGPYRGQHRRRRA